MPLIDPKDALAISVTNAIQTGDTDTLRALLSANRDLARSSIGTTSESRTLLHIATDWPGHFPNVASTIKLLVLAGADVNARMVCPLHSETPLHFAASSDDLDALDALLAAGADIESTGGVIADGTPLTDARAFRNRRVAERLLERDAKVSLQDAAGLGVMDRLREIFTPAAESANSNLPSKEDVDAAFWNACHGSSLAAAQLLKEQGADVNAVPSWAGKQTPLDVAKENGDSEELVAWLKEIGAKSQEG